jgi:phosphoglycolate phosphatase-like HAD superfamily hydrolase
MLMQDQKMQMQKKTVILFDLDGTLTDPGVGITKSVNYALESFGIYTENLSDLCKFIGPPLTESFMRYYGFDETKALLSTSSHPMTRPPSLAGLFPDSTAISEK